MTAPSLDTLMDAVVSTLTNERDIWLRDIINKTGVESHEVNVVAYFTDDGLRSTVHLNGLPASVLHQFHDGRTPLRLDVQNLERVGSLVRHKPKS